MPPPPPPPPGFSPVPPPPPGFSPVASSAPPPPPPGFSPVDTGSSIKDTISSIDQNLSAPITGPVSGAIKGAGSTAAGIIELANKYSPEIGAHPEKTHAALQKVSDFLRQHTQTHGLFEGLGEAGESAMELMALPEVDALGVGAKAATAADKLAEVTKLTKYLETNTKAARVLRVGLDTIKSAARSGAEQAGQSYVKTGGDTDAAESAGITGGVVGGALGGGVSAVNQVAKALKPGAETLEGVTMPVAASQRPNASSLTKLASPPSETAVGEAQQAAAPQVISHGAKRAVKNVLDEVNLSRGEMQGPVEEAGVPPGAFKFTIEPHGQPVETTDPNIVRKLLGEAQDVKATSYNDLGPRQQTRVDDTIQSLSDQLDQYHTERATRPHFTPADTQAAVDNTDDYRTAGEHIQDSVDDVFQRMRGAANEQLDKKWLKQLKPSEFDQLMEANADKFSPEERQIATDTFRKGAALKEWHDAIHQGFNISPQQAAATADIGGERTFTGSNKISNSIDNVVAERGDDLRSMIGDEGIRSVRRMNQLMQDPDTGGPLQELLRRTASVMRRHYGGLAGMAGAAAAPFLGVSHLTGMTTGAATGYALKKVIDAMASNPEVADRLAYAVKNKVASHVAAPIISTAIVRAISPETAGKAPTTEDKHEQ